MAPDLINTSASVPEPLLAMPDLDTIVFLVVVGVSLLGRLFGKKDPEHAEEWIDQEDWQQQQREDRSDQGQPQMLDWEQEMRRLLEGRAPAEESAPPPLPGEPEPVVIIPPVPAAPRVSEPSRLASAEEAYRKAQELKAQAAARMAEVGKLPATKPRQRGRRSAEAQAVINLLRGPKSARKAIIATEILGPAKGLQ